MILDLKVMDSTAASMCRDNDMPLLVFGLNEEKSIMRALSGDSIGTYVSNDGVRK